ncbi:tubulin beta chain [Plakobranchus ocellatus]|uniref:Tubulin beta chain n=1 Tax=Plakobranchus ocellatus TaxID=259542 RepID=A0AAV4ADA4_9GAST|nr:tubulin beta chain [Plakobranchus ocellatus]
MSAEHSIDSRGNYHGVSALQLEKISAYYHLSSGGRYSPNGVFVDLDPAMKDDLHSIYGKNAPIFVGKKGTDCNWPEGFYRSGNDLAFQVMDHVRHIAEACGGTGSGLGTLLCEKLHEEYPDAIISTFSVMPSFKFTSALIAYFTPDLPGQASRDVCQGVLFHHRQFLKWGTKSKVHQNGVDGLMGLFWLDVAGCGVLSPLLTRDIAQSQEELVAILHAVAGNAL